MRASSVPVGADCSGGTDAAVATDRRTCGLAPISFPPAPLLLIARDTGTIGLPAPAAGRPPVKGLAAMMKLLSHPFSPYGRKVKIAIALKGLADRIEVVTVDTNAPDNPELHRSNPLAKIPALVIDDSTAIFDSHVICEYLDSLSPAPVLFPRSGVERIKTLTLGSLCDGILDAALLLVYEKRFRPEDKWHAPWLARQQSKIDRSIDHLEKAPPAWGSSPDYGHVTLACALGYLDFRHEGKWRAGHPRLVAWLDAFAKAVPAFEETRPKQ
jgi:glutathione S-transferase